MAKKGQTFTKYSEELKKEAVRLHLEEHILAIHRLRPAYGYKRMRTALRKEGFPVNHKKVRRLMRELGIQSVIRKNARLPGVILLSHFQTYSTRNSQPTLFSKS
jgi:transposase InsO family protein